MNKLLKIFLGLILIIIPLYFVFPGNYLESWGIATLNLLKAAATILVFLIGIILIILGLVELKN